MSFVGFSLVFFGIVVIAAPEIIAYVIGVLLILAGANLLLLSKAVKDASKPGGGDSSVFRFGEYEIFRNRK